MKRIARNGIGLVLALGLFGLMAAGQSQPASSTQSATSGSSLGDYARQIRKDTGTNAKPKVYDNDNLPTDDKLSIVGPPPTAAENSDESKTDESGAASTETKPAGEAKASAEKSAPPAKLPEDETAKQAAIKQWSDKLSDQKNEIDLNQRELDVLQREYQVRAAAMYGDVGNRLRNSADWDKQDAQYKQQIADKQKSLDDAKQKLDDLQEQARKAGVPESDRSEQ
jgi:hypothetical protein